VAKNCTSEDWMGPELAGNCPHRIVLMLGGVPNQLPQPWVTEEMQLQYTNLRVTPHHPASLIPWLHFTPPGVGSLGLWVADWALAESTQWFQAPPWSIQLNTLHQSPSSQEAGEAFATAGHSLARSSGPPTGTPSAPADTEKPQGLGPWVGSSNY